MNKMFLIVGESGSGKDSLTNKVCKELNMKQVISYTTRPQRKDEGNTHIFIKPEEARDYINEYAAYTQIGEIEYFTTLKQLLSGEYQFYIIDPNGVKYLKDKVKNIKFVTIFIYVDRSTRLKRTRLRGDDEETIVQRFWAEYEQFKEFKNDVNFDYMINNYNFNTAYEILKQIIMIEDLGDNE